ncbi:GNAT family N-acetyltransferase [Halobacterium zhouii]|uniref:GNAT family N-acetyltransferase n=1 Tax=Halobacterium zhouii TaxID=2902624 RepID=UPI001E45A232|nr:GNAT family N-acetyltransferase [Halobacterium zhouii]
MTSSFRLSPQQIDNLVENLFDDDRLSEAFEDDDAVFLVSEADTGDESNGIVGFFWGTVRESHGDVRWLFVDPEYRGQGIGTQLFENGVEGLRDAGADTIRAFALQASLDGHQFFEQFGFEQTDERQVEVGDETLAQFVYTASSDDAVDSSADP